MLKCLPSTGPKKKEKLGCLYRSCTEFFFFFAFLATAAAAVFPSVSLPRNVIFCF